MNTVTASIFVELEIKVSATHVKGCPESHDPPSPAEPAGWEDITIEAISLPDGLPILSAPPWRNDLLSRQALASRGSKTSSPRKSSRPFPTNCRMAPTLTTHAMGYDR